MLLFFQMIITYPTKTEVEFIWWQVNFGKMILPKVYICSIFIIISLIYNVYKTYYFPLNKNKELPFEKETICVITFLL